MKADFLIKQGFIVDGTGNPGFYGDLAIVDEEILAIETTIDCDAKEIIEASGLMVCPGLIDPHVHEETVVLHDQRLEVFLRQGVTTIINGNCGHSVTPGRAENVYNYYYQNGLITQEARDRYLREVPPWEDFASYCQVMEEKKINLNMGFLLGHGTIRWNAMGGSKDRPPTPEEEKKIMMDIEEGMLQGALGLSTGLSYIPSRYADTEEIIRCAKVVAKHDGVYATHARYPIGILESTQEAIEIGKQAKCRVQVSHLTPMSPESFTAIWQAREEGLEIAVDTIPRSTGHLTRKDRLIQFVMALSTTLFDQGVQGVREALQSSEGRALIREETDFFDQDMEKVFVVNTGNPQIEYRSIAQLAKEQEVEDPTDLFFNLLADECENYTFWTGGPSRNDFPLGPHPAEIQNNPLVMVGTDTIFGEPWDPASWYELQRRGGFPIFMEMYRQGGVRVEEIIRRNTSMAARQFRFEKRGLLFPGMKADIALIDLNRYHYPLPEEMDYSQPETNATGVEYVFVNGKLTMREGKILDALSGKILKNKK